MFKNKLFYGLIFVLSVPCALMCSEMDISEEGESKVEREDHFMVVSDHNLDDTDSELDEIVRSCVENVADQVDRTSFLFVFPEVVYDGSKRADVIIAFSRHWDCPWPSCKGAIEKSTLARHFIIDCMATEQGYEVQRRGDVDTDQVTAFTRPSK